MIAFIAAAILTPPDVISQVGLAIPMIILYEASIIGVRLAERSRRKEEIAEAKSAAAVDDTDFNEA